MKKPLLIATMLLGLSGIAFAGGPHGDCMKGEGFHHKHHRGEKMLERKLDLTEEQQASIDQIRDQYREQMRDVRGDGPRYGEFMDLDPNDPNYQEQVRAFAEERAEEVEQRILLNAEKHAKIHAVLTEEQREKLKELHEKRKQKFKERYQNRME